MSPLFRIGLALLLAGGAFGQRTQGSNSQKKEPLMEQIIQEAGLDLRNPRSEALDKAGEILRRDGKKGIWIAAPSPLAIDQDRAITVYGFDFFTNTQRPGAFVDSTGVVVGTRVESRQTFAALVAEPKEPSGQAPTSPAEPPEVEIDVLLRFKIPLRERLEDLPWRAGTYLVDVLLDTQTSNRLQFQLTPGAAAEKDPAVAAYIEAQKAAASTPTDLRPLPVEGQKYPVYGKNARSLPIPGADGITLEADRVSVYRPDAHSVLRGSFRLPVPAAFYRGGTGDGAAATAAVPITLVITGNLMTGPFVAPLRVAAYTPIDRDAPESTVTGQFEIDLFALQETSKVPQTYTIWAYSGAIRSAPATAAVITPEMLK